MKGLLLKDWYITVRHCRVYLGICVLFLAIALLGSSEQSVFFLLYPGLLAGILPVTLLSYEERDGWDRYCDALPLTRAMRVSEKYLFGLLTGLAALALIGLTQAVRLCLTGSWSLTAWGAPLFSYLILLLLAPAVSLPWMFRLGVERGRIFLLIAIALTAGGGAFFLSAAPYLPQRIFPLIPLLCGAGAVLLYLLSWRLSVFFYRKREW